MGGDLCDEGGSSLFAICGEEEDWVGCRGGSSPALLLLVNVLGIGWWEEWVGCEGGSSLLVTVLVVEDWRIVLLYS